MRAPLDLIGQRFDRLLVTERLGSRVPSGKSRIFWRCRCDCGNISDVRTDALRSGFTRSCGCRNRGGNNLSHGHSRGGNRSTEYMSWQALLGRCRNPNNKDYEYYGGRGIMVCRRWQGRHGFENFFSDLGERPSPKHSLDRWPDKNGNYEPTNCRWATPPQQQRKQG